MTLKLDLRSHASQNIPIKQGGARRMRTLFRLLAENQQQGILRLLQQNLPKADK